MKILPDLSRAHILVMGDLMLDCYWSGISERISPEAPVPIVKILEKNTRPGGAANVAINIATMGCAVSLLGLVGDDDAGVDLCTQLTQWGVSCYFDRVTQGGTISKLRVVEKNQQMLRLDFDTSFLEHDHALLQQAYREHIHQADVVLLSDYGKGTLKNSAEYIALARAQHVPVLVDPKGHDFSIYAGATLITPNLSEFEAVVGRCGQDEALIVNKAKALAAQHQFEAVLVTRGKDGMSLVYADDRPACHLHAHAREVFDVTGAGDTVIAFMAVAMANRMALEDAAYFANIAAGLVVKKHGTAVVSLPELRSALRNEYGGLDASIVSVDELMVILEDAKAKGEKIVMTNGCFDILHPGHIAYLAQAKELGDRLIIAVNSDDSVRRLKGPHRPVNNLSARMRVLAGLRSVDWVIAFDEDTPAALIETICPDVLVKGGDYRIEDIAGHETVQQHGGSVQILPFVQGYSTTDLIKKINNK